MNAKELWLSFAVLCLFVLVGGYWLWEWKVGTVIRWENVRLGFWKTPEPKPPKLDKDGHMKLNWGIVFCLLFPLVALVLLLAYSGFFRAVWIAIKANLNIPN